MNYFNINFPYFVYPGAPFHGYYSQSFNINIYRALEKIRSLRHINSKKILFHITIGSPMEEAGSIIIEQHKVQYQMHQLVPDHILRALSQGIHVINIIICPNAIKEPLFMKYSGDYAKINKNTYTHKSFPLEIFIYKTMMPTKDTERNKKFMSYFNGKLESTHLEKYCQTSDDILFVNMFYSELKITINHIIDNGGYCSCFSFAVFNDDSIYRSYKNFVMFKEVSECYKDPDSTILCEWVFRYGVFVVCQKNCTRDQECISYIPIENVRKFQQTCKFIVPSIKSDVLVCRIIKLS